MGVANTFLRRKEVAPGHPHRVQHRISAKIRGHTLTVSAKIMQGTFNGGGKHFLRRKEAAPGHSHRVKHCIPAKIRGTHPHGLCKKYAGNF